MLTFKTISLHGAPRSGTSWLGKVFDSHPDVAYRFQPLFSYRFKGAINLSSTREQVVHFLTNLNAVNDDEFILQLLQKERGVHPGNFTKNTHASIMVMKEVRYHYVIETLLRHVPDIRIVGIVRNPCGAINSWLKTPREFKPEWNPTTEWSTAQSKNKGNPEEYYGYEKWKELAKLFLSLKQNFPHAFMLVRYESLVSRPIEEIITIFKFCGLELHPQVLKFLADSQAREVEDPDSVFRTTDVASRWKKELAPTIRDAILRDAEDSGLAMFLD